MISRDLERILVCPLCRAKLKKGKNALECSRGHSFESGEVPILLGEIGEEQVKEREEEDKLSKDYIEQREQFLYSRLVNKRWNETILDLIDSKPKNILELGCGTGILLRDLKEKFKSSKVFAFDLSYEMAKYANTKNRGNVVVADVEAMPFRDNSFDLIIARGVLHHVPSLGKALKEIRRVLRKGGVFVLSEPNNFNPFFRLYRIIGRKHRAYTPGKMRRTLESKGFKLENETYFGFFTFPYAFPDLSSMGKKKENISWLNFLTGMDKRMENSFLRKLCWHLIFKVRG